MVHIKIKKGLDIPLKGQPSGMPQQLILGGEAKPSHVPLQLALDLKPFGDLKLRLLIKEGDNVVIGQPLVEDKSVLGRYFVSPASGIVGEIRRGAKRALLEIVIDCAQEDVYHPFERLDWKKNSREELIEGLKQAGIFATIRVRPFNVLADPTKPPRAIFVKALESSPLTPPAELHLLGKEAEFQAGLDILSALTDGKVHLVYSSSTTSKSLLEARNVEKHTAEGPHPVANQSLHIQKIDPINRAEDIVWTLHAADVVAIGYLALHGRIHTERIISIAGPGILPGKQGFFKIRHGCPIAMLISGRIPTDPMRLISGDPLMGTEVKAGDFLGFSAHAFCAIPENNSREFAHFFRLGVNKYSCSRAYLSGHRNHSNQQYDFTTNQHGEHRPFIDSSLYDKVMPLDVPTMLLVKAVMAEDFDLAISLGLLEVDSEDFALPTFVCPSKMEMCEIIKEGLKTLAKEVTL